MRMGRVPVILSDDWVEPIGPSWEKFSIRIRERDVDRIPAPLEKREADRGRDGSHWREHNGKNGFRSTFAFIA